MIDTGWRRLIYNKHEYPLYLKTDCIGIQSKYKKSLRFAE